MERPSRVCALVICSLLMTFASAAEAQEARGTITGTVRDTSQGVVPGASVTITNVAMGTTVSGVTNDVGFFQAT